MDAFVFLGNLLASALRLSTPLIFAGMAGLLSFQVGLVNISLEGLMLVGAFTAVAVGAATGSAWLGVFAAALVSSAFSMIFALFVTRFRANLIVAGLAMNFLALGGTAYLLPVLFKTSGTYAPTGFEGLNALNIPGLSDVPVLGSVLLSYSPLVYLSWLAIPLTVIFCYRTLAGIHIRAVGENQEAARTSGIRVTRMQFLALALGGLLCGVGGAHLSVGDLALFREGMTAGRGFIALAAVYFASGRPVSTALACLLFGLFEALQFRLQTTSNVPPQFFQMLPYLIVVVMLTFISVRKEWKKGW